jgi:hypothetical protein
MTRTRKAEKLYELFHQFEPVDVGDFPSGFRIPKVASYVGTATVMYYTSDKLNPETLEDEGDVRYYHDHKEGVRTYLIGSREGEARNIPKWIWGADALVRLGDCDGLDYEDFDGETREMRSTGRKPEWYCVPSGKALLVIQDRRRVLAVVWGGELRVEDRGVVG